MVHSTSARDISLPGWPRYININRLYGPTIGDKREIYYIPNLGGQRSYGG